MAVNRVINVVKRHWQSAAYVRIAVFGSLTTGLVLPSSDIDLVVVGITPTRANMHKFAHILRQHGVALSHPAVIAHARVPILKYVDKLTGVAVDISFNQTSGLHTSIIVNKLMDEYKQLRPLVTVLKYFLYLRDLHEPVSGGLGGYALVLMTTSFLQVSAH